MLKPSSVWIRFFPFLGWLSTYNRQHAQADFTAALIVTAMLIPQGMAYAMLAGLPPIMGLYASILPMIFYAIFGGSPTLAIGPVALISMMVAATLEPIFAAGSVAYIQGAWLLALMSGVILLLLGLFRFGFLIHLISHPVIKSFIMASACLIALSQLKLILNLPLKTNTLPDFYYSSIELISQLHLPSLLLSLIFIGLLVYAPDLFKKAFKILGFSPQIGDLSAKATPLFVMLFAIASVKLFALEQYGIQTIGDIPTGLPSFTLPHWNAHLFWLFLPSAFMIAMISFVEAISIAQATALKSRGKLNANQELIALGLSNLSAGMSNGFPVTGSLSRTVVNADAGARSPLAGVISCFGILLISLFVTDFFRDLPLTVLAATIFVSIIKLIDFNSILSTWRYAKADAIAMLLTLLGVLFISIEQGLFIGIISAALLLLWRMSRPHIAIVGLVPNTQHFRNIERFNDLQCSNTVLSIRMDESLTFLNAHTFHHYLINALNQYPNTQHVVIICSSVNRIDASALDTLNDIYQDLTLTGVQLHFSEIKGFLMDQLKHSDFFQHDFKGQIFLAHYQALRTLDPDFCHKNTE